MTRRSSRLDTSRRSQTLRHGSRQRIASPTTAAAASTGSSSSSSSPPTTLAAGGTASASARAGGRRARPHERSIGREDPASAEPARHRRRPSRTDPTRSECPREIEALPQVLRSGNLCPLASSVALVTDQGCPHESDGSPRWQHRPDLGDGRSRHPFHLLGRDLAGGCPRRLRHATAPRPLPFAPVATFPALPRDDGRDGDTGELDRQPNRPGRYPFGDVVHWVPNRRGPDRAGPHRRLAHDAPPPTGWVGQWYTACCRVPRSAYCFQNVSTAPRSARARRRPSIAV